MQEFFMRIFYLKINFAYFFKNSFILFYFQNNFDTFSLENAALVHYVNLGSREPGESMNHGKKKIKIGEPELCESELSEPELCEPKNVGSR